MFSGHPSNVRAATAARRPIRRCRIWPPTRAQLARITSDSNELLFLTVERVADVYQNGSGQLPQPALLRRRCETTLDVLLEHRNAFMLRHQGLLLRALEAAE